MTVQELMDELFHMPRDAEVVMLESNDYGESTTEVWGVGLRDFNFRGQPYQEVWLS